MTDQVCINEVQELGQELEKFRQIVENAGDAVVTANENHEVVYMNQAAEKMFGYSRHELLGGDLSPLIPHELRASHRSFLERYIATRVPRLIGHTAELEGERRDGTRFPMSIGFSVAEVDGRLLFTAIMRDLSAERSLAEQVKRSEKLAAVGQLVATVNHEIRTPLSLIGGFARQVLREPSLTKRAQHKLDIIVEEVARLEGLLLDLNDLSRPQNYNWHPVEISEVAAHVVELMAPELAKNQLRLSQQTAPGLPQVVGDKNRLSQVLINLIQNSAHASPPGSEISLEAGPSPLGGVVIKVRDHGSGIAPEDMEKIFNPFFTTKKRGTGLGLPLARRIVAEHGGRLKLDSTPGQGATATITLPPSNQRA